MATQATALLVALTVACGLATAQQITGQPGAVSARAVVSMTGMAVFEQIHGLTNRTQKAIQAPWPRGRTNGLMQQPGAASSPTAPSSGPLLGPLGAAQTATGINAAAAAAVQSPAPATSFQAILDNNTLIPPDTQGAVGPNHVMTTLNSQIRIQDRTGKIISTVTLNSFWKAVGNPDVFDPHLSYDPFNDRWIFSASADAMTDKSSVLLAVSQNGDPTGNWYLFRVDADPSNVGWADYDTLGFNKDWIVVSVNMFPISFLDLRPYIGENIYVFSKTNLYANGSGRFTLFQDNSGVGFTMVPAVTYDNELSTMYLVQVADLIKNLFTLSPVSRLQISTISGPVGSEVLNLAAAYTAPTNDWGSSDPFLFGSGLQLGTNFGVDLDDTRIINAVYRNGSLWCSHTIFLPSSLFSFTPFHAAVQWWQLAPDGEVQQLGRIEDPVGIASFAYPSIAVNRCNDVLIGYSSFSPTQFVSADYSFRFASDPPNTLQGDFLFKAGEGPYFKDFGSFRNRWGDYSATVVDPANDLDFWTLQEYAATPASFIIFGTNAITFDLWGTWWAQVDVANSPRAPNRIEFSSSAYQVNEATPGFATITVLNTGGSPGSIDYATSDGTAIAAVDYERVTGTLTFAAGQTSTNFSFRIYDNAIVNPNKAVNLTLSNPQGGAFLGCLGTAVLTIIDDETLALPAVAGEFNFSSYLNYGLFYTATVDETIPNQLCGDFVPNIIQPNRSAPGAIITVVRTNGSTGKVLVDFATEPGGFSVAGQDYFPTNGTLVFDDYQMSANFVVRVAANFLSFGDKFVRLVLSNPRPASEEETAQPGLIRPKLGNGSEAGLVILDINNGFFASLTATNTLPWFNIERANYRTDEYGLPFTNGGVRYIDIDVTLFPLGGPGTVRVIAGSILLNNVYLISPFQATLRSPDPSAKITIMAGSDHAEAFEPNPVNGPSPVGSFSVRQVWPNPIYLDPALTTITNYSDYMPTAFDLTFPGGRCRQTITLIVTNDSTVEFDEEILVALEGLGGNPPVGINSFATVTIMTDDQPAGAADREWNPDNASNTFPAFNSTPGANDVVNAVAVQADGKTVLGGDFTAVNARPRNRIARLAADGSVDLSFEPGTGADGSVSSIALYPTNGPDANKVLIVGGFSSYNSTSRPGIARLFSNGTLDSTFTPGTGADGTVRAIALQTNGQIIIAGDFTHFNDETVNGLARLQSDGSLDLRFDVGAGADGFVWTLALQPDGQGGEKVLVGGDFLNFNGVFRGGIARLNTDGSVETGTFEPGGGADGPIYAMSVQTNGTILIAGGFSSIDLRPRSHIARLNPDGSLDLSFDPGTGPNDDIRALTLQPDGKPIIGGFFTSYTGTRRIGLARLRPDGTLDTTFMDTAYNQFAGIINEFSFQPPNYVGSIALQPDGNVLIGGSFTKIGGNPSANAILRNNWTVFTRADKVTRYNIARVIGGVTPGPGNAAFDTQSYFTDENAGTAYVKLQRTDGRLGTLLAESAPSDRLATAGLDYLSNSVVNLWPENYYETNQLADFPTNFAPISVGFVEPIYVPVPILDDKQVEGDATLGLSFLRPGGSVTLGGEYIPLGGAFGRSSATLTIVEHDVSHGVFNFGSPQFVVNENGGFAVITVIRTNGSDGAASVNYFTRDSTTSPSATANKDYLPTQGRLSFISGQTSATFRVPIIDDTIVEFDENIDLVLTNATGGATLPGGVATSTAVALLTIIDNDFPPGHLNFTPAAYTTNEDAGAATVLVTRTGGSVGAVSVQYRTVSGSAVPGVDYINTNGVLSWNDGETVPKTITVPLLLDFVVDGLKTLSVQLFNPRVGNIPNASLPGLRTNAALSILDSDAYGSVAFNQSYYQVDEAAGSVSITVARSGGVAGPVTVNYAASPDTAVPGLDFVPVSGVLTFQPGEVSQSFSVPILDDGQAAGNKAVTLTLSNPVNVSLGVPNQVTLTIFDKESFNEPAGSLDPSFNPNGKVNGPVFGVALQLTNGVTDGRLVMVGDFTQVNQVTRNRLARLMTNGTLDVSFDAGIGPNDSVKALAAQQDGKVLIGGFFSQVLSTNRNFIARLNIDGTMDISFNPGAGADNPVYALTLQPDQKVLVGGSFSTFGGLSHPGIVRLNTNGTVDASFNPGGGANGTVFAVAAQADGKVLIGGDFTVVAGTPINRLARLNRDGSLDTSFTIGGGFDAAVRTILAQPDGRIVVGGSFIGFNGAAQPSLARLNADGTLDAGFLAGQSGANNAVYALAQQVDGKLVVAGDFSTFNGVTRNRLTRLNSEGTTDPTINFGDGANSFIATLVIQPDRKIVLGGGFTTYDDQPREHIARIHGGGIAGPGALEFSQPVFRVSENATNALISVRRRGGTTGLVGVNYNTSDGTAIAPLNYLPASGTLTFPSGETRQSFLVSIIDDFIVNADRTVNLALSGYTGGATAGPQPVATLVIVNDESLLSFSSISYSVSESGVSGNATLTVLRSGATNTTASVNFQTTPAGSAIAFTDYIPTNGTLTFVPGVTRLNFNVRIRDDLLVENNETVGLALTNPSGSNSLGIAAATLTIVNSHFAPGQLQFSSASYTNLATDPSAAITVVRTNGYTGVVSVRYGTRDGTAQAGADYVATSGILSFADGETQKTFLVPLVSHVFRRSVASLSLSLFSASGGATLGTPTNATLTIIDNRTPAIIAAGSVLLFESGPTNNAIDPGENVTVSFALRNAGLADTGDLMATLLPGNGVTFPPGGPQDYGVLFAGGASVSRPFNFTAVGANGDRLLATLLLTDNGVASGTVTFAFTLGGRASVSRTNANFITINDNANATPYPSQIDVANVGGLVTKVTVTLSNINHTFPHDIDVLLVSPSGEEVVLMADTGGGHALNNGTLTFDDAATNKLLEFTQITNGTYKPTIGNTNRSVGTFVPPAPPSPHTNTFLSVFNGIDPNGTWSLYVVDDTSGDSGNIAGGWILSIHTSDPVASSADLSVTAATAPEPVLVGANLTSTVSFMNHGPLTASNVVMHAAMPDSLVLVSATSTLGVLTHTAGVCACNIGALTNGQRVTVTIVAKTTAAGTLSTLASVASSQNDINPGDNSATVLTTVMPVPRLSVLREGDSIILSWPAPATGFVLEFTPSLSSPNWLPVNAVSIVAGAQIQVTETAVSGSRFYRLREP